MAPGAQSQATTQTVTGRPSCATCEIVLEKVFTVTDRGDSLAVAPNLGVVRDSRGRFYFLSFNSANGIVVYDSTGTFVSRFGRAGEGPGEFGAGFRPLLGKGDTVFVCGSAKCHLFGPDYKYVRTIQIPQVVAFGAVVLGNGDIATKGAADDPVLDISPIRRFSTTGQSVSAFGYSPPVAGPCTYCMPSMGMGLGANGEDIWVAPAGRYELQLWGGRGDLKKRIVVTNSPWFPEWDPVPAGSAMSRIEQVIEREGVLFLVGTAARLEEGPAPPLPPGTKITVRAAAIPRANISRSPHIEAVDVASGTVLAARSVPGFVSTFGGQHLVSVRDGNGSDQLIDVWKISLRR